MTVIDEVIVTFKLDQLIALLLHAIFIIIITIKTC